MRLRMTRRKASAMPATRPRAPPSTTERVNGVSRGASERFPSPRAIAKQSLLPARRAARWSGHAKSDAGRASREGLLLVLAGGRGRLFAVGERLRLARLARRR